MRYGSTGPAHFEDGYLTLPCGGFRSSQMFMLHLRENCEPRLHHRMSCAPRTDWHYDQPLPLSLLSAELFLQPGLALDLVQAGAYRAPIEAETSRDDSVLIGPVAERNTW